MKSSAIKVLDVVALLRDIPESNLKKGQVGTVVEQLDDNVFEIEFLTQRGETIALESFNATDLFLLHFEVEKV